MPQDQHHATLVFPGSTRPRTGDARPSPRRAGRRASSLTLAFTLGMTLAIAFGVVGTHGLSRAASPSDARAAAPARTPAGLWLSSTAARAVVQLSPGQLATDGVVLPTAMRIAAGVETHSLVGLAFDDSGRLWVANQGDSLLLAFAPANLARKETRVPATVLSATNRSLSAPVGLAFDPRHRLWAANFGNGTLVRFDAAQLSSSGAPAPSVIIGGLHRPSALAFDAAGTLWVSDMCAGTVSAYDAVQLERSGSPEPRVVIRRARGSLAIPTGLAFDADGSLWVAELGGVVNKFTREQLAASGTPVPAVEVAVEGGGEGLLWGAAFWPKAPRGPRN